MARRVKQALSVAFVALLVLPFVAGFLLFGSRDGESLESEHREFTHLSVPKKVGFSALGKFFGSLDLYVSDRLIAKDEIVLAVNDVLNDREFFFSAFDIDKGVVGEDGFIFFNNHKDVLNRHFRKDFILKPSEQAAVISKHVRLSEHARSLGGKYILFVAPDKHGIYCEKYPTWLRENDCGKRDRTTELLMSSLRELEIDVLYPYSELRDARGEHVYYKTDTHWNPKGAEVGASVLCAHIFGERKNDVCSESWYRLNQSKGEYRGDALSRLGLVESDKNEILFDFQSNAEVMWRDKGKDFQRVNMALIHSRGEDARWEGSSVNANAPSKMKALVICDSFMASMTPQVSHWFEHVRYISRHADSKYLLSAMDEFKPDYVIFETVERDFR